MKKPVKVVLTGGGTAGHVMPHIAMLPAYKELGWTLNYIGSDGIEHKIISEQAKYIKYHSIMTGKLRRYFSWQNFLDVFKVIFGTLQSFSILLMLRPTFVFSKGGFVSVPVSVAAWLLRIPIFTHESDLSPGLATKIIAPLSSKIFCTFPKTKKILNRANVSQVGLPVRRELLLGDRETGAKYCGFDAGIKTILFMGGSLGAQRINECLETILPELCESYQIIHITGKGKNTEFRHEKYISFEFVGGELPHLFALADYVVTRAGANSIFEFLALKKPMLLIPLEIGSRGDQVENAAYFSQQSYAMTLSEHKLSGEELKNSINDLMASSAKIVASQTEFGKEGQTVDQILKEIKEYLKLNVS
ncbi:MAG: undecaprenyldiphospho-muramoylpentapeptide beta-N-acetylglucosaminyltransferase [Pseudobacteriovorax sp.]|nr:undecaprenyldiphospho-muramoylpentapeptide beta-N-acetylglucosaminyltransferase [Pseudobacteriovorax sp.]